MKLPGVTLDGARWLSGRGIFAAGSDTASFERMPSALMEVHVHLLVECGIHIMECLRLEELAAAGVGISICSRSAQIGRHDRRSPAALRAAEAGRVLIGCEMGDEFQSKTALVTGASRGIGAATAIALARAGCKRVYVHYNSSAEGAERTAEQIRQAGAEAMVVAGICRVKPHPGVRGYARGRTNAIDYLVNNAGSLVRRATLAEFNYALFDEVMN